MKVSGIYAPRALVVQCRPSRHARAVPAVHTYATVLRNVRVLSSSDDAVQNAAMDEEKALFDDFTLLTDRMQETVGRISENLNGTSIYLVGLMGAGKSTCGRIIAKALGYYFFDTDELIEKLTGRSVAQIFAEDGEDEFRQMETDVLKELAAYTSVVVATGGGIPTRRENWGYMQHGVVAWLDGRPELLAKRVVKDGSEKRPLVAGSTGEESEYDKVVSRLTGLLEKRKEQYQFADLWVSLEGEGQDSTAGAPAAMVAYRVLTALERKMRDTAEEREARKNFKIEQTTPLPGMRVVGQNEAKLDLATPAAPPAEGPKQAPKEKAEKKGFGK